MSEKKLKHAPLLETVLEVKWKLKKKDEVRYEIPYYDLLVGQMFNEFKDNFPIHERLPSIDIPAEFTPYQVKQRFRSAKDDWPLFQLGPGILTLNCTEKKYTWDYFLPMAQSLIEKLNEFTDDEFEYQELNLNYLDRIPGRKIDDIIRYFEGNLKIKIDFDKILFKNTDIIETPLIVEQSFVFPLKGDKGNLIFNLKNQKHSTQEKDLIFMQVTYNVQSNSLNNPHDHKEIIELLDYGHHITDQWFFNLISGNLKEEFDGSSDN